MGVERIRGAAGLIAAAFIGIAAVGCGGGGGGGSYSPSATVTTPSPVPNPPSQSLTANLSTTGTTPFTLPAIAAGYSATVTMPAVTAASSATLSLLATLPSGVSAPQAGHIGGRQIIGGTNLQSLAYVTVSVNTTVSASNTPAFSITFPGSLTSGSHAYIAYYDEKNASAGWTTLLGPGTVSGNTISFSAATIAPPITLQQGDTYVFALVTSGSLITPAPSPSPGGTPGPTGAILTGPSYGGCTGLRCLGGYGPLPLANAFQFPVQSGYNGAGQTIAIVIDDVPSTTDLSAYETYFQIPVTARTITSMAVDGGGSNAASAGEALLDAETIAGLAPGANIVVYDIPSLNSIAITDAYNQIITDGVAKTVNSSFGGCEFSNMSGEDTVLAQGAAAGIAFTASSGDQGDECPATSTTFTTGVNYPASDPNVIGVGGTETYPNATPPNYQIANPVAWNDTHCSAQCATGGGVSTYWTLPAYQNGLAGTSSQTHRNVPDVAMPAAYAAVYENGAWSLAAGTSWSAPTMAAMMAEVYEYCGGTSFVNPVTKLYSAHAAAPADFLDVTSGNNQYGTDATFYAAGAGYDNVSGLGVPNGMALAQTICPSRMNPGFRQRNVATIAATAARAAAVARTVDVTPRVPGLTDLGRRNGSSMTGIQLVLRPTATIASDEAAVVSTLKADGFTIERTFSNHLVVDAVAPSSVVESTFSTRLDNVSQAGSGTAYLPASQAVIPASLNPYVASITLDNVVVFHTHPLIQRL